MASGRLVWVFCRWCGHAAKKNPRELFWNSRNDVYLREVARRMRCERCTNREAVIFAALHLAPGP